MAGLHGIGVWASELPCAAPTDSARDARAVEALGYRALWIPDVGGPLFEALDALLDATSTVTVASGILNIWQHTPAAVAQWWNQLPLQHRDRVMIGLGVSHGPLIGDR